VIIDMGAQDLIDLTSQEVTHSMYKELHEKNITIYLADVHKPLIEASRKSGMLMELGEYHVFPSVDAAVRHIEENS
jgi:MFS superfamily sulfate permease-like transporter